MTNNETPQKVRKKSKVFAITVMVIMTSLLLFNILKSPTEFSELENRNLTQLNAPTFATIFNGEFMDNFSSYVTDQFAFRDFFVGIKANIERFMGKKGNNGVHFGYDNYLIQRTQGYNQKEIDENINAGRSSYIANTPPRVLITNFHINTIAAPPTIPAIAPALLIRFQNKENSISGPKVAPKPAHAKDTILNITLFSSNAINTAITAIARSAILDIVITCLSLASFFTIP